MPITKAQYDAVEEIYRQRRRAARFEAQQRQEKIRRELPELDGLDRGAVHLWLEENGKVAACARVMDRGVESEHVSIGRVVTAERRSGLGSRILAESIRAAQEYFNAGEIYLEAQAYATGFYEREGFVPCSEVFLEDGIPHVQMRLKKNADR